MIVNIDTTLFTQVIKRVLDNAFKFTKKGSVELIADRIKDEGKEKAVIKINDTGIGIAESQKDLVFEAFRQASEGLSRKYEGSGLGLTLSKKLIELMDGSIELGSEEGKGSTLTIMLPIAV